MLLLFSVSKEISLGVTEGIADTKGANYMKLYTLGRRISGIAVLDYKKKLDLSLESNWITCFCQLIEVCYLLI